MDFSFCTKAYKGLKLLNTPTLAKNVVNGSVYANKYLYEYKYAFFSMVFK